MRLGERDAEGSGSLKLFLGVAEPALKALILAAYWNAMATSGALSLEPFHPGQPMELRLSREAGLAHVW